VDIKERKGFSMKERPFLFSKEGLCCIVPQNLARNISDARRNNEAALLLSHGKPGRVHSP
jgi:hypothetical protein